MQRIGHDKKKINSVLTGLLVIKIKSIEKCISSLSLGKLQDVDARDAYQVLNVSAHVHMSDDACSR